VSDLASAYSATGVAWERGPGRIYNRLAGVVVGLSPVELADRVVIDLGAGTGAASRAIARAGGTAVAIDPAWGMLAVDRPKRPPAVQADALALPIGGATIDGVVAAFSINHVSEPVVALRESARACRPGSPIVVSTYAGGDAHPAKDAVTDALREHGFEPDSWVGELYRDAMPRLADPTRCADVAKAAGLDATVHAVDVAFPELGAAELVEWRLGMAQHASFLASLAADERAAISARAVARLADAPTLVRSILVITAISG
jgi:ubiquinone/menaquinone biosynthesis C-methylase UbiE